MWLLEQGDKLLVLGIAENLVSMLVHVWSIVSAWMKTKLIPVMESLQKLNISSADKIWCEVVRSVKCASLLWQPIVLLTPYSITWWLSMTGSKEILFTVNREVIFVMEQVVKMLSVFVLGSTTFRKLVKRFYWRNQFRQRVLCTIINKYGVKRALTFVPMVPLHFILYHKGIIFSSKVSKHNCFI